MLWATEQRGGDLVGQRSRRKLQPDSRGFTARILDQSALPHEKDVEEYGETRVWVVLDAEVVAQPPRSSSTARIDV